MSLGWGGFTVSTLDPTAASATSRLTDGTTDITRTMHFGTREWGR